MYTSCLDDCSHAIDTLFTTIMTMLRAPGGIIPKYSEFYDRMLILVPILTFVLMIAKSCLNVFLLHFFAVKCVVVFEETKTLDLLKRTKVVSRQNKGDLLCALHLK